MNDSKLSDALLLRAYRGEQLEQPPIWLMRQAGRYLPEYQAVRAQHSMLTVIRTAELAAEVTLQPIRRFGFDAAIIFADILNPLIGMGIELDFVEGEGPKIFNPISSAADVDKLSVPPPEENVAYTLEAIALVTKELTPKGVPLIGFAGAPFTLSSYMLRSSGEKDISRTTRFMRDEPAAWNRLQDKLVTMITAYLIAQVRAGASAVQLFDSWIGALSPSEFRQFAAPSLKKIIAAVKRETSVPVVYFGTNTAGLFSEIAQLGADVVGVDWRISLSDAQKLLGASVPLQGNLDPTLLFGPPDLLRAEATRILQERKAIKGHVFNLGHGILPKTPIAQVELLIETVRSSAGRASCSI